MNSSPLKNSSPNSRTVSSPTICHICPSISAISLDEDRINALYSPFRSSRSVNPESYDHKLKFWTKAIEEWVEFGSRFTFTLKQIQKGMMIRQKTPACVPEVLQECQRNGSVLTEQEFYDGILAGASWRGWGHVNAKRLVGKLIPGLPKGLSYFSRGSTDEVRYVHVTQLKSIVDSLMKAGPLKNRLLGLEEFKQMITSHTNIVDAEELNILLEYLKITKYIELDKVGTEEVVLFGDSLNSSLIKISDVDKGKYDVARSIQIHEEKLEETHVKISEAVENAKKALKQGRRATAKHELKKKKLLEARVDKLLNVVDSLTVISMQVEEAESDAKILLAYKSGKEALSNVHKKNNLTADSVTEALLDLQDVLEDQAEMTAAISQPLPGQDDDLAELDAELDELMREDKIQEEQEKKRKGEEEILDRLKRLRVRDQDIEDEEESFHDADEENINEVPSPNT